MSLQQLLRQPILQLLDCIHSIHCALCISQQYFDKLHETAPSAYLVLSYAQAGGTYSLALRVLFQDQPESYIQTTVSQCGTMMSSIYLAGNTTTSMGVLHADITVLTQPGGIGTSQQLSRRLRQLADIAGEAYPQILLQLSLDCLMLYRQAPSLTIYQKPLATSQTSWNNLQWQNMRLDSLSFRKDGINTVSTRTSNGILWKCFQGAGQGVHSVTSTTYADISDDHYADWRRQLQDRDRGLNSINGLTGDINIRGCGNVPVTTSRGQEGTQTLYITIGYSDATAGSEQSGAS